MSSQVQLLGARRFLPLFATQTLGAFEDNLFKSAFVMLVTYGTAMRSGIEPGALAARVSAGGAGEDRMQEGRAASRQAGNENRPVDRSRSNLGTVFFRGVETE